MTPPARRHRRAPIDRLLDVMARLRAPDGCPWDREQDHRTLRWHAVEEVYELVDAIEAGDDSEMAEELGDLLLQIVFHAQLAKERGAFDFDSVCGRLVEKLIRRHPHVFGQAKSVKTTQAVWAQWDQIKKAEKAGARIPRHSALDGIPRHLPALLRAEKLAKKARKAGLVSPTAKTGLPRSLRRPSRPALGRWLFELTAFAQARGWSAEELLRMESQRREQRFRSRETKPPGSRPPGAGPVPATRPTGLQ